MNFKKRYFYLFILYILPLFFYANCGSKIEPDIPVVQNIVVITNVVTNIDTNTLTNYFTTTNFYSNYYSNVTTNMITNYFTNNPSHLVYGSSDPGTIRVIFKLSPTYTYQYYGISGSLKPDTNGSGNLIYDSLWNGGAAFLINTPDNQDWENFLTFELYILTNGLSPGQNISLQARGRNIPDLSSADWYGTTQVFQNYGTNVFISYIMP